MPGFKKQVFFKLRQGVKAFLGLEAGTTRNGTTPAPRRAISKELAKSERTGPQDGEVARLRRQLAATEAKLSEAQANLAKQRSSEQETPVFFVVGQPKSGTAWLMKILDFHPEIICKGGGRFFGRELRDEEYKEMQVGKAVRAKIQPSSLYNALLDAEYLRLWIERSIWSRNDNTDEHLNKLTRLAIDHFLTERLSKTNKRLVGDKTPLFTPKILSEISVIYPEAKVIHIIRDGRDQAVSWMHHLWRSAKDQGGIFDLEPGELAKRRAFHQNPQEFLRSGEGIFLEKRLRSTAEDWKIRVGRAIEDGPALLGANYVQVRYEDLLERPEEEAGRLFEFLGADASKEIVSRCVESARFEKMSGRERGQENYSLNFGKHRKGIAGDWKNVFTERDKAIFKEEAGGLLIKLGYERDSNW
jgi:hypothetical protein